MGHFKQPFHGREALYHLWRNKLDSYPIYDSMRVANPSSYGEKILDHKFNNSYDETFHTLSHYKQVETIAEDKQVLVANHIHQIWCLLYQEKEYQLDSLFRTAYRLISWIDSQQPERLTEQQKWMYISIFRSQLSWIEMVFLYYNGLTGSGKKFKLLIEKYALLDNLTFDSDIGIKVMNKYFDIENNYSKTAFNSELAREISQQPITRLPRLATRRATQT
ncbi:MAG: putative phage abortive infection protein [Methylotenera sp.]